MNKYQEAYKEVSRLTPRDMLVKKIRNANELVKQACEKAEEYDELTKIPTLEEVKREWEALGYIWKENSSAINLYGKKYGLHILLDKDEKEYFRYDTSNFTLQEHQLITKTMKALGWM